MSSTATITTALTNGLQTLAMVCPAAPPGMQSYQDLAISWIKWGVIGLIIAGALVSIGAMVVGKIFRLPHVSTAGAIGICVCIIAAILFVTIVPVLNGIFGSGC